jgi:hypothetical protein
VIPRRGTARLLIPVYLESGLDDEMTEIENTNPTKETRTMDAQKHRSGTLTLSAEHVELLARHGITKETGKRALALTNRFRADTFGTDTGEGRTITASADTERALALSADHVEMLERHGIKKETGERAMANTARYRNHVGY